MLRTIVSIVLRTAFCAIVAYYAFRFIDVFAIAVAAPLAGALLARPIIDLVAETNYAGKAAALEAVQGKWYMHRDRHFDIAEDTEKQRWLLTSDVRKVIDRLPRDEVLEKQFGERVGRVETFEGFRIRADAMMEYLHKSHDMASLKFKRWLDQDVMGGSKNPRAR